MDKKIALLLTVVCIALGGMIGKIYLDQDHNGPVITFADSDLTYTKGMTEEDYLDDVEAVDDVDGDVSDSLVIESVYNDKNAVSVTYVARDKSNNISKVTRFIEK